MKPEEIKELIDKVPYWWHSIDLGHGIVTNGDTTIKTHKWKSQVMPEDLTGKTVLDLGAWDGYYSFLAESRNAKQVLAIDNLQAKDGTTLGFETAKKILNSKVEHRIMDALDIDKLDNFDIIICFGLYYHVKNIYELLEKCYNKCNEMLLVEGHVIDGYESMMYFYNAYELNNDPTNYWGMTESCLIKMLSRVGFKKIETISKRNHRILIRCFK